MGQAVHHHLILPLDLPQPCLTVAEVLALQLLGLKCKHSFVNSRRFALRTAFCALTNAMRQGGNYHHKYMASQVQRASVLECLWL